MDPSLPPSVERRMNELEQRLANIERAQNPAPRPLDSLADVAITQSPRDQDALTYNSVTGQWEPASVPGGFIGEIAFSARLNLPPLGSWVLCNGALASRSDYSALFNAIGTAFGAGDGSTTFALPNIVNGRFVRGATTAGATGGTADAVVPAHAHHTGHTATNAEASGLGLTVASAFENRVRVNRATGPGTGDLSDSVGVSATDANLPPWVGLVAYIRYAL